MSGTNTTVADDPRYEPLAVEDRYPPAAATPDPDSDKGWFRRLLPLLIARRLTFGATLVCGIAGLTLQVSVPMVLRRAIDVALDQRTGSLEAHVWTLVAIAGAAFGLRFAYRYLLFCCRCLPLCCRYLLLCLLFEARADNFAGFRVEWSLRRHIQGCPVNNNTGRIRTLGCCAFFRLDDSFHVHTSNRVV